MSKYIIVTIPDDYYPRGVIGRIEQEFISYPKITAKMLSEVNKSPESTSGAGNHIIQHEKESNNAIK